MLQVALIRRAYEEQVRRAYALSKDSGATMGNDSESTSSGGTNQSWLRVEPFNSHVDDHQTVTAMQDRLSEIAAEIDEAEGVANFAQTEGGNTLIGHACKLCEAVSAVKLRTYIDDVTVHGTPENVQKACALCEAYLAADSGYDLCGKCLLGCEAVVNWDTEKVLSDQDKLLLRLAAQRMNPAWQEEMERREDAVLVHPGRQSHSLMRLSFAMYLEQYRRAPSMSLPLEWFWIRLHKVAHFNLKVRNRQRLRTLMRCLTVWQKRVQAATEDRTICFEYIKTYGNRAYELGEKLLTQSGDDAEPEQNTIVDQLQSLTISVKPMEHDLSDVPDCTGITSALPALNLEDGSMPERAGSAKTAYVPEPFRGAKRPNSAPNERGEERALRAKPRELFKNDPVTVAQYECMMVFSKQVDKCSEAEDAASDASLGLGNLTVSPSSAATRIISESVSSANANHNLSQYRQLTACAAELRNAQSKLQSTQQLIDQEEADEDVDVETLQSMFKLRKTLKRQIKEWQTKLAECKSSLPSDAGSSSTESAADSGAIASGVSVVDAGEQDHARCVIHQHASVEQAIAASTDSYEAGRRRLEEASSSTEPERTVSGEQTLLQKGNALMEAGTNLAKEAEGVIASAVSKPLAELPFFTERRATEPRLAHKSYNPPPNVETASTSSESPDTTVAKTLAGAAAVPTNEALKQEVQRVLDAVDDLETMSVRKVMTVLEEKFGKGIQARKTFVKEVIAEVIAAKESADDSEDGEGYSTPKQNRAQKVTAAVVQQRWRPADTPDTPQEFGIMDLVSIKGSDVAKHGWSTSICDDSWRG
mgnify:CR=1 FL=1